MGAVRNRLRFCKDLWARSLCVHRSGSFHTHGVATDASRVDSERMVVPTHTRTSEANSGMQIKTILNRIQKHRGFVYGDVRFEEHVDGVALTVDIVPHRRNRPTCSGCRQRAPAYDRLAPRRFEFVPLWGLRVFFLYMMRRVDCPRCGVTVEQVPWADGKHQLTTTYLWFLAPWDKRLSWQEVAIVFRTSWDQVFRSVAMAVAWGRDHVDLTGIRAIGVDEIHWQRGAHFLTLVYQIDATCKRLLWIGQHRRAKTQYFLSPGKSCLRPGARGLRLPSAVVAATSPGGLASSTIWCFARRLASKVGATAMVARVAWRPNQSRGPKPPGGFDIGLARLSLRAHACRTSSPENQRCIPSRLR